jgi:hypothetical protein
MKDSYVAVQPCGCMTAWISLRYAQDASREVASWIKDGLMVESVDLDDVRDRPEFLPAECVHDPKGWEPRKPQPYAPKVKWKKVSRGIGDARRVEVVTPWSRGYPVGDARKVNGKWWITEGWFNWHDEGANKGDEAMSPAEVEGPFDTQKEAGARLAEIAMDRSRELYAQRNGEDAADRMLEYEKALV